jgi:hypothetical protein
MPCKHRREGQSSDDQCVHHERMPDEITPAIKAYEALIGELRESDPLATKAVESASGYRTAFFILDTLDTWPTCPP